MAKVRRKKPLRGVIPGSSKFARISSRAVGSMPSPCSLEVKNDVNVVSTELSPTLVESALSPQHATVENPSDLISIVTSGPVQDLDLTSLTVEGTSSGAATTAQTSSPSSPHLATVVGSSSGAVSGLSAVQSDDLISTVAGSSARVDVLIVDDAAPAPESAPSADVLAVTAAQPVMAVSPPREWVAVARGSSCLEEIGTPTQHISGAPFVLIPDENIEAAKAEFKDYIFAQFHGPPPEMGRVIGVVNAIWARTGPRIFVHRIGPGAFLLRVHNSRTREVILSRNLWNIANHPMFVAPWSPEFTPETPPISSAAVTVEFRGVPYLLFNDESLSRLATAVGKPVALAPETARKENFEVAKVIVRVDLLKDLPSRIVSGFSDGREIEIEVSYPWLPPKCVDCNVFGHATNQCRRKIPSSMGRKVTRRSTSRKRSRSSRSSRQVRKEDCSRPGRSRPVYVVKSNGSSVAIDSTLVSQSPDSDSVVVAPGSDGQVSAAMEQSSCMDGQPSSLVEVTTTTSYDVVAPDSRCELNSATSIDDLSVKGPLGDDHNKSENKSEQPFFLPSRRKSGRKAASLH